MIAPRLVWMPPDFDVAYVSKSDYDELKAKLTETERLNKVALEAMKELEWCETEYDPAHGHSSSCPSCGGASKEGDLRHPNQEYGHYDDCPIANAIKEIEGALK